MAGFERFAPKNATQVTEDMLPRNKQQVLDMVKRKEVAGFHSGEGNPGHAPTNFPLWLSNKTEDDYYDITYKNIFEPYIMGYKHGIPRYWPFFRGFGYDKFSWFFELNRAGYKFSVFRDFYMIHMNHPILSKTDKKAMTEVNRPFWQEFKRYLSQRYGA